MHGISQAWLGLAGQTILLLNIVVLLFATPSLINVSSYLL